MTPEAMQEHQQALAAPTLSPEEKESTLGIIKRVASQFRPRDAAKVEHSGRRLAPIQEHSKRGRALRRKAKAAREQFLRLVEANRKYDQVSALPLERREQLAKEAANTQKRLRRGRSTPPPNKLISKTRQVYGFKGLKPIRGAIRVSRVTVVKFFDPAARAARDALMAGY